MKEKTLRVLRLFLDERSAALGKESDENDCVDFMQQLQELVEALGSKDRTAADMLQRCWDESAPLLQKCANETDFFRNKEKIETGLNLILFPDLGAPSIASSFTDKLEQKVINYAF